MANAAGQWVTVHGTDGTISTQWKEPVPGYDLYGQPVQAAPISPAPIAIPSVGVAPPSVVTPQVTFDPLLSPTNILQQGQDALAAAKAPVDPTKFIAPGAMALMTQGVNEQAGIAKASAQSDFAARGMTGSSTEVQTLTRDLPAAAQKALAEGTVKLLQAAYPLAIADKQTIVDATFKTASLTTQVRQMIGDEKFKQLSLDQQAQIANQDVQLKLNLADIEMKFQAAMQQAQQAWQGAENDKDRAAASAQFEYLKSQRKNAQLGAFTSSLTTLAGAGIGFMVGGPVGAVVGAGIGSAGGGLANLFMTD